MCQREQLRAKLEAITIDGKCCVDFGSGAKPAARYVKHTNCEWLCIDKNPDLVGYYKDLGVEYIVSDLLSFPIEYWNAACDIAFCLEVLEHVLAPQVAVGNIFMNLNSGGKLYLSVPFLYPEHGEEDYWRFTKNGLRHLLEDFSDVSIEAFEGETGYWVEAVK